MKIISPHLVSGAEGMFTELVLPRVQLSLPPDFKPTLEKYDVFHYVLEIDIKRKQKLL